MFSIIDQSEYQSSELKELNIYLPRMRTPRRVDTVRMSGMVRELVLVLMEMRNTVLMMRMREVKLMMWGWWR